MNPEWDIQQIDMDVILAFTYFWLHREYMNFVLVCFPKPEVCVGSTMVHSSSSIDPELGYCQSRVSHVCVSLFWVSSHIQKADWRSITSGLVQKCVNRCPIYSSFRDGQWVHQDRISAYRELLCNHLLSLIWICITSGARLGHEPVVDNSHSILRSSKMCIL